jgi:hypothetical protein
MRLDGGVAVHVVLVRTDLGGLDYFFKSVDQDKSLRRSSKKHFENISLALCQTLWMESTE